MDRGSYNDGPCETPTDPVSVPTITVHVNRRTHMTMSGTGRTHTHNIFGVIYRPSFPRQSTTPRTGTGTGTGPPRGPVRTLDSHPPLPDPGEPLRRGPVDPRRPPGPTGASRVGPRTGPSPRTPVPVGTRPGITATHRPRPRWTPSPPVSAVFRPQEVRCVCGNRSVRTRIRRCRSVSVSVRGGDSVGVRSACVRSIIPSTIWTSPHTVSHRPTAPYRPVVRNGGRPGSHTSPASHRHSRDPDPLAVVHLESGLAIGARASATTVPPDWARVRNSGR